MTGSELARHERVRGVPLPPQKIKDPPEPTRSGHQLCHEAGSLTICMTWWQANTLP